ncbi:MAG TPA: MarR family transcriptional regulator [Nocardioides sp.]|nr:MarR family transcriptional regulator [Nocardioides sp.]
MARTAHRPPPSLLYAVKQVELAVRSHLDDLLRPTGVTALQYTALTVLEQRDDLTAAALARNSFVTTQSMADLVAALERRGLVERFRDPTDGRRILIHLTDAGRALIAEQRPAVAALERSMIAGLEDADIAVVRSSLDAMRRNLES